MAITIINQPLTFTGMIGDTFGFRVDTEEQASAYQWQYSADGISGWSLTGAGSGNGSRRTPFLYDEITAARVGAYYRCRMTNPEGGYTYSNIVQLLEGTTPPVMAQLLRLWLAKAAILSAISEKGVTVPSNSDLEDFPALINQIGTT